MPTPLSQAKTPLQLRSLFLSFSPQSLLQNQRCGDLEQMPSNGSFVLFRVNSWIVYGLETRSTKPHEITRNTVKLREKHKAPTKHTFSQLTNYLFLQKPPQHKLELTSRQAKLDRSPPPKELTMITTTKLKREVSMPVRLATKKAHDAI